MTRKSTAQSAPAQEPIGWITPEGMGCLLAHMNIPPEVVYCERNERMNATAPLYAAPPPPPAQEPVATLEAKVSTLLARALTTGYGSTEAIYALANLAREPLFAAPPPDEARDK